MERKNVAWNMIGSLIYAGSSMILTALVNHIAGTDQGGIFGFAFSTFGQQMFLVAYFGMRPMQSTDISRSYSFSEYRQARVLTCLMAVVMGIAYILWNLAVPSSGYTGEKALVVFLMVLYKVLDGFADVYESEFQRNGKLYLTGQAMTFRTLLSVGCFLGALAVTKDLVLSCFVAVISQGIGILLFDKRTSRQIPQMDRTRRKGKEWNLLRESFLLFLSVFLDGLIFAMAKYAVDAQMTSTDNAIFVAIFMPTSIINLAANFVIRPFLTRMSYLWEEKELKGLLREVQKLTGVIIVLTAIALAGAWLIGVPVLGAISNVDLRPYKSGLLFIILGGGFFAVMNLFYYVLVIMKRQKGIFWGYVPVCVLSYFLAVWLVRNSGINGGAVSYMLSMGLLMICFMGQAVYGLRKKKKEVTG
ncbi:lipopolysaccharide biosynthesis protein [Clostridium sp. HBUAS56010]|uniref:lipopolysaccharide biosynthesis protein n=1 Tax=Clostridium sp. HBUAS56010 TaxID=2571127 RepID=UPI001178990C|nr:lipopolysaccharide biosynthesis protein [Clostridium sp. HBUAS56010]